MFVLGVDPGLSRCGYAVLQPLKRGKGRVVSMGLLKTPKEMETPKRLAMLARDFRELLEEFEPDAVAMERVFFQKNLNTALGVVQACGVMHAAAIEHGATVTEYSPTDAKSVIAGDGRADKEQIQFMVANLLGLKEAPQPADVADACAMALCHLAYNPKSEKKLEIVI